MDATVVALVSALAAIIVPAVGGLFALYQFRNKRTREADHALAAEQESRIKWRDEEIARLTRQNEALQQKSLAYLQVLSTIYRQPPELIEWQLNNNRQRAPETRN